MHYSNLNDSNSRMLWNLILVLFEMKQSADYY